MRRTIHAPTGSGERAPGRRRGQAMVEFSIAILLFLGMLAAIFEGARLVASYFALGGAAREGARAGVYVPSASRPVGTIDADVRAKVRQTVPFLGNIPDGDITICRRSTADAACGTTVQSGSVIEVTVQHTFQLVPFAGGWLGRASVPLTGYQRTMVE
jgi:Flp pilus assembly protein TadG